MGEGEANRCQNFMQKKVSQGKLILVREKSGKFALLKLWTPCHGSESICLPLHVCDTDLEVFVYLYVYITDLGVFVDLYIYITDLGIFISLYITDLEYLFTFTCMSLIWEYLFPFISLIRSICLPLHVYH